MLSLRETQRKKIQDVKQRTCRSDETNGGELQGTLRGAIDIIYEVSGAILVSTYLRFTQIKQQFAELSARGGVDSSEGGAKASRIVGEGRSRSNHRDANIELETNQILKNLRFGVPKFSGSQVHQWIYKIEKFFSLQSLSDAAKLQIVAFHMEGEASAWYQWMEKNEMLGDWGKFVKEVKNRFGHSAYEDPVGKISKLTQSGSVARFRAVEAIPESMLMIFFLSGD